MTIMSRGAAEFWWKMEVPKEVAYYYHDGGYYFGPKPKWKVKTFKEILDRKKERQEAQLSYLRLSSKTVPGFVWVFHNNTTFFCGWYIYIKTLHKDFGISFRHEHDDNLIEKAMQLYPCGVFPVLDCFDEWAQQFSKQYRHVGFNRKKNQGIAKCWCLIDEYGKLKDVYLKCK